MLSLTLAALLAAAPGAQFDEALLAPLRWRPIGPPESAAPIRALALDDAEPYRAHVEAAGLWRGPSRTHDTRGITERDWVRIGEKGSGLGVLPDPRNPDHVVVLEEGPPRQLVRRDLRTAERVVLLGGDALAKLGRVDGLPAFLRSRQDPDRLYVAGQAVLRIDVKAGIALAIGPEAGSGGFAALAESPVDRDVLWAGSHDGRLWVSSDAGQSWTKVTPAVPSGCAVAGIEASRFEKATAFVAFACKGQGLAQLHASRDLGRTWASLAGDLRGPVHVVREDPVKPTVLYAGTDTGAFVTIDRGGHWAGLRSGLPAGPVRLLAVQERVRELVAGTGSGLWVVEIAPFRELAEALGKPAHLFSITPVTPAAETTSAAEPGFHADNPPQGALITYFVRDPQPAGVAIELYTLGGERLVRRLPAPGDPGLHRLVWDLAVDGPAGARAEPGRYRATLAAGALRQHRSVLLLREGQGEVLPEGAQPPQGYKPRPTKP